MTTVTGVRAQGASTVPQLLTRRLQDANNELMEYAQQLLVQISDIHEKQLDRDQKLESNYQALGRLEKVKIGLKCFLSSTACVSDFRGFGGYAYVSKNELSSKTSSVGLELFGDAINMLKNLNLVTCAYAQFFDGGAFQGVWLTEKGKAYAASLKTKP